MEGEIARVGSELIKTCRNPRYREGSIVSLWAQQAWFASGREVLLMDGDVLFTHVSATRVRYPIALESQAEIMRLLAMTPYYWHVGRAAMEAIEALVRLELTVDAYVNVFRPSNRAA